MITATSTVGATEYTASTAAKQTQLDRDAFLKMLIVQLKNQDPLQPMEDREFIAQLAQFSTLEQMQQMNKGLSEMMKANSTFQAVSLIGRTVVATDTETNNQIKGKVDRVLFENGIPLLKVGDHDILLGYVISVE